MQQTRVKGAMGFLRDFWIPRNSVVPRRGPFPPWNFLTSFKKKVLRRACSLIGGGPTGIRVELSLSFSLLLRQANIEFPSNIHYNKIHFSKEYGSFPSVTLDSTVTLCNCIKREIFRVTLTVSSSSTKLQAILPKIFTVNQHHVSRKVCTGVQQFTSMYFN